MIDYGQPIFNYRGEAVTEDWKRANIMACRAVTGAPEVFKQDSDITIVDFPPPLFLDIDHMESPHATSTEYRLAQLFGLAFQAYFEPQHYQAERGEFVH